MLNRLYLVLLLALQVPAFIVLSFVSVLGSIPYYVITGESLIVKTSDPFFTYGLRLLIKLGITSNYHYFPESKTTVKMFDDLN